MKRWCVKILILVAGVTLVAPAAASADVSLLQNGNPNSPTNYLLRIFKPYQPGGQAGWISFSELEATYGAPAWDEGQVQSCMEQLLTGGWQLMNWTCQETTNYGKTFNQIGSNRVPYLTNGRWYRSYGWGWIQESAIGTAWNSGESTDSVQGHGY